MHALITELETRSTLIAAMNLRASLPNAPLSGKLLNLANVPGDLDRVARAINVLVGKAGLPPKDAEDVLRNVLNERSFYGGYCELGAYDWFDRHHVDFKAQIPLTGTDVLNPNGCSIDGQLLAIDAYFDVKGTGFVDYIREVFRKKLAESLTGWIVTIDGTMDVAVKDIDTHAFGQIKALVKKLGGGGREDIPQLGWTIRVSNPTSIATAVHTANPYCLAEENRHFPLKTARQFTRNAPFVLVFAYAAQFTTTLFQNPFQSTEITH